MQSLFLYFMSALYALAGIYHFVNPRLYLKIMPPYLPFHLPLVYISGFCEILLSILLLPASTRTLGAWGIIILLIAIFPANLQMAGNFYRKKHSFLWLAVLRLPLQLLLIWWAWTYT
jgi:uncharacterized membrane protein